MYPVFMGASPTVEPDGKLMDNPFAEMTAGPVPKYKELPDKYRSLKRWSGDPKFQRSLMSGMRSSFTSPLKKPMGPVCPEGPVAPREP